MSVRATSAIRLLAQRLVVGSARQRPSADRATEGGLTLLECLIAIVIVSITMISITPPIFWATATRVQNRRAEQAQALAQAEIDRVRTLVERGSYVSTQLPPDAGVPDIRTSSPVAPTATTGKLRAQDPACNQDTGVQPTLVQQVVPVNTKGPDTIDPQDITKKPDCTPDFLVQTFRSTGSFADNAQPGDPPYGFVMGVRVYSAIALDSLGSLKKERASLQTGNALVAQRTQPLAVLYSVIVRNNTNKSLEIYRSLCPNKGTASNGC